MGGYQHIDLHVNVVASLLWEQQRKKDPNESAYFKDFLSRNGTINRYPNGKGLHIVGRGNAIQFARLIVDHMSLPYVCSNQDDFKFKYPIYKNLHPYITIVSASGSKGLPELIGRLSKSDLTDKVNMVTSTPDNETSGNFPNLQQIVIEAMPGEPYTYNFSTYGPWLMRATGEKAGDILETLRRFKEQIIRQNVGKYNSFSFLFHPKLVPFGEVIKIKIREMFGNRVLQYGDTPDSYEHGPLTVEPENELLICFGTKPKTEYPGDQIKLNIKNPNKNVATVAAALYFVVGYIQQDGPIWFKQSIEKSVARKRKNGWNDKTVEPNVGGKLPPDLVKQAKEFVK